MKTIREPVILLTKINHDEAVALSRMFRGKYITIIRPNGITENIIPKEFSFSKVNPSCFRLETSAGGIMYLKSRYQN
ncbi:MAG: hypothetical protein ACE5I5_19185 [Candidatus Heimdallarchaeota archaeon]